MEDATTAPRKKLRLDGVADAVNWGADDEFSEDVFAQVDMVATQIYSQTGEPSINHYSSKAETKFQRHNSWTASPNENLPLHSRNQKVVNLSASNQLAKQKTAPFWSNVSSFNGRTTTGHSVQEIEWQKHELKSLKEEKHVLESRLKTLQDALVKKDTEIQTAKQECILLKQQCDIEKRGRLSQEQEVDRLKTELNFKCQELTSEQWRATQQQQQHFQKRNYLSTRLNKSASSELPLKRQLFKSQPKEVDDTSQFPSSDSFTKRLSLQNIESQSGTSSKSPEACNQNHEDVLCKNIGLRVPRTSGTETGPGLVNVLLNEAAIFWPSKTYFVKNGTTMSCSTDKSKFNDSSSSKDNDKSGYWEMKLRVALGGLLVDDGAEQLQNPQQHQMPEDLYIFKTFLGLHPDSACILLPIIEDALKDELVVDSHTVLVNAAASSSGTSTPNSPTSVPVVKSANRADVDMLELQHDSIDVKAKISESTRNVFALLSVLKQLVCYSPLVRHYLIQGDSRSASTSSQTVYHVPSINSPLPGPFNTNGVAEVQCDLSEPCSLMKILFSLCSLPHMNESKFAEMLLTTLEIFTTVASYSHIGALSVFLPIIKPLVVQNCTSLMSSGSVFIQFVSFLCTLCCSKSVIEATCNQEDFCLWLLLTDGWEKAREELAAATMLYLDKLMIKLLSQCITSEEAQPPFLAASECPCPFEVISSVICYLHKQQNTYEKVGHLDCWPTLQKGISLLYQIVHHDEHFYDHRAGVTTELFSFLQWLPKLKKTHNLGPAAESLVEMWNMGETSEGED